MTVTEADRLGQPGARTATRRTDRWRWDVLDAALGTIGTVVPVGAGVSVSVTVGGSVNRTARNLRLTDTDAASIDPARDWLRPVWVDVDGIEWPQGTFRIASATTRPRKQTENREQPATDLTLADGSVRHQARNNRAVGLERDLAIADAVARLADWLRIRDYLVDPTTAALGAPLSWALGEASWSEIVGVVAKAGGMLAPHFDNAGVWRWRVAPDWATATADFTYRTDAGQVIDDTTERAVVLLDDPNVFYAVGQGNAAAVRGRYPIPDQAPNSVARIGYEIPEMVESGGLGDEDAATAAARAAYGESDAVTGPASLAVPFDPAADLFAIVSHDGWRYRALGHSFNVAVGSVTEWSLARLWLPDDAAGELLSGTL